MIGRQVGQYLIQGTIGAGAMSTVYKALDQGSGRQVALKVLHSHLANSESRERFIREAKVLATLSDRRSVKILQPLLQVEEMFFTVLEYVEGQSLAEFIRRQGLLPPLISLFLVREVVAALLDAHSKGVIHRDLKPENILISVEGRTKVSDFGLARITDSSGLTKPGTVIGSPAFMPPEQILGKVADLRADLFSLGLIHYNILTGELLFGGKSKQEIFHRILNEDAAPALKKLKQLDAPYRQILGKCLAKDREERYQSSAGLAGDIDDYLIKHDLEQYRRALESYLSAPPRGEKAEQRYLADCLLAKGARLLEAGQERTGLDLLKRGFKQSGHLDTMARLSLASLFRKQKGPARGKVNLWRLLLLLLVLLLASGVALSLLGGFAPSFFRGFSLSRHESVLKAPSERERQVFVPTAIPAPAEKKPTVVLNEVQPALKELDRPEVRQPVEKSRLAQETKSGPTSLPQKKQPSAKAKARVTEKVKSTGEKGSGQSPKPQKVASQSQSRTGSAKTQPAKGKKPLPPAKAKGVGYLDIRTTPWAYIFVDDKYLGETPFDFALPLPAGKHKIRLKNPYCKTKELEVTLQSGQTEFVDYRLEILPARVTIKLARGIKLSLDGKPLKLPKKGALQLEHGFHRFTVHLPDGESLDQTVELKAGKAIRLSVEADGSLKLKP